MPIAIVTGANRGLGLETSRGLAKRGYRVWLTGRDGVHVGDAVVALRATGLDVVGTTLDIADAASIREFQETEIIIAPSIKTEGKLFQTVQSVGMGTR